MDDVDVEDKIVWHVGEFYIGPCDENGDYNKASMQLSCYKFDKSNKDIDVIIGVSIEKFKGFWYVVGFDMYWGTSAIVIRNSI